MIVVIKPKRLVDSYCCLFLLRGKASFSPTPMYKQTEIQPVNGPPMTPSHSLAVCQELPAISTPRAKATMGLCYSDEAKRSNVVDPSSQVAAVVASDGNNHLFRQFIMIKAHHVTPSSMASVAYICPSRHLLARSLATS